MRWLLLCLAIGVARAEITLLAHRGISQPFDRAGLTNETCTAARMLPPTHGYLENTLASMAAAFEYGADIVEFDIHPTTDGQFAVFHDWRLECRTDGQGVTREQSMAHLWTLDIGHGYTADGGRTFPFRGKFVAAMPTWADVMAAFPGRRFLVNVKSNDPDEGHAIVAYVRARNLDLRSLSFSGGDAPMEVLRAAWPGVKTLSRARLKSCGLGYLALGWTGYVPAACRDSIVYVPIDYTHLAWGWPERFLARMAAVNAEVFVIGPLENGLTSGVDDPEALRSLPAGYRGGVLTDRIEVIGPVIRRNELSNFPH